MLSGSYSIHHCIPRDFLIEPAGECTSIRQLKVWMLAHDCGHYTSYAIELAAEWTLEQCNQLFHPMKRTHNRWQRKRGSRNGRKIGVGFLPSGRKCKYWI